MSETNNQNRPMETRGGEATSERMPAEASGTSSSSMTKPPIDQTQGSNQKRGSEETTSRRDTKEQQQSQQPSSNITSVNDLLRSKSEVHDVLNSFHMTIRKHEMLTTIPSINFHAGNISPGQILTKDQAQLCPRITFSTDQPEPYAVMIVDPDAPNGNYLHYLACNLKKGDNHSGHSMINYAPPTPPSGTHRYIVLAFKQNSEMDTAKNYISHRQNFNTVDWCNTHNFHLVGINYWKTSA